MDNRLFQNENRFLNENIAEIFTKCTPVEQSNWFNPLW